MSTPPPSRSGRGNPNSRYLCQNNKGNNRRLLELRGRSNLSNRNGSGMWGSGCPPSNRMSKRVHGYASSLLGGENAVALVGVSPPRVMKAELVKEPKVIPLVGGLVNKDSRTVICASEPKLKFAEKIAWDPHFLIIYISRTAEPLDHPWFGWAVQIMPDGRSNKDEIGCVELEELDGAVVVPLAIMASSNKLARPLEDDRQSLWLIWLLCDLQCRYALVVEAVKGWFDALLDESGDEPVKHNGDVDNSEALVIQGTEETIGVGNNVVKLNDVDLMHTGLGSRHQG
ncbi:hypothetical protein MA16_Dca013430 [Dendrobium catenatum]|uniref:Uncharacterized protein n=1 Tax=Dendrobium catenatum TaxID=906689 RepID=A0A2I0X2T6_9ASPA|nr:hypothetical protein MA16_Dca013430 [Dendrobium catenatum]